jgi:hypothetical protein
VRIPQPNSVKASFSTLYSIRSDTLTSLRNSHMVASFIRLAGVDRNQRAMRRPQRLNSCKGLCSGAMDGATIGGCRHACGRIFPNT